MWYIFLIARLRPIFCHINCKVANVCNVVGVVAMKSVQLLSILGKLEMIQGPRISEKTMNVPVIIQKYI